eukprot:901023-Prorocentrum_minimum.AAC.1
MGVYESLMEQVLDAPRPGDRGVGGDHPLGDRGDRSPGPNVFWGTTSHGCYRDSATGPFRVHHVGAGAAFFGNTPGTRLQRVVHMLSHVIQI